MCERKEPVELSIAVERSGDWMPAEDFREAALAASRSGKGVVVSLGGIDHLDASSLQILLALDLEQKKVGTALELANPSPQMRQWFEYAGAEGYFFSNGAAQK